MLISYNSELIREVCFNSSFAIKHLGEKAAVSLHARHSDIQAAGNVYDLLVGHLSVDENLCVLTVQDLLSIVMVPNYRAADRFQVYDWSTVERVKLMGINDVK